MNVVIRAIRRLKERFKPLWSRYQALRAAAKQDAIDNPDGQQW